MGSPVLRRVLLIAGFAIGAALGGWIGWSVGYAAWHWTGGSGPIECVLFFLSFGGMLFGLMASLTLGRYLTDRTRGFGGEPGMRSWLTVWPPIMWSTWPSADSWVTIWGPRDRRVLSRDRWDRRFYLHWSEDDCAGGLNTLRCRWGCRPQRHRQRDRFLSVVVPRASLPPHGFI